MQEQNIFCKSRKTLKSFFLSFHKLLFFPSPIVFINIINIYVWQKWLIKLNSIFKYPGIGNIYCFLSDSWNNLM